jgi:hypothetical protein
MAASIPPSPAASKRPELGGISGWKGWSLMPTAVIIINEDIKCSKCGKPGAAQNGLCFECAVKIIERRVDMEREKINGEVIGHINGLVRNHMLEDNADINLAFRKFAPKVFDITFKVKMLDTKEGVAIAVEKSYYPEPKRTTVKESVVSPEQLGMWGNNGVDPVTGEVLDDEN